MDEELNAGPAGPLDPGGHLASAAADCVHCGFCLPACPTYQLWGEEMDSPRGRIHLISQVLDGAPVSESVTTHLDRCLGCMACMTACPSGVRYNELIEAARAWPQEPAAAQSPAPAAGTARSLRERAVRNAIFATFPYPRRLRALSGPLRAAQRTGLDRLVQRNLITRYAPELASSLRLAPQPPARRDRPDRRDRPGRRGQPGRRGRLAARPGKLPVRVPAVAPRRAVVGMLTGCVQQVFFPEVNAATARVLAAEGCDVIIPPGQGCCGALSLHSGRPAEAARFAEHTIATFEREGVDVVVVNSAGCGSAMKEFGATFARTAPDGTRPAPDGARTAPDGDARSGNAAGGQSLTERAAAFSATVRDLSEFLAELYADHGGPRAVRHELPVTAAYHDACHLAHAQRIRQQPRDLLRGIPELDVTEASDGMACCGSAGVYNLLQPEAARELGERKAAALRATGARLVVSANPGCSLQIAAALAADGGEPVAVAHIAEVLDASFRGLPVTALTDR